MTETEFINLYTKYPLLLPQLTKSPEFSKRLSDFYNDSNQKDYLSNINLDDPKQFLDLLYNVRFLSPDNTMFARSGYYKKPTAASTYVAIGNLKTGRARGWTEDGIPKTWILRSDESPAYKKMNTDTPEFSKYYFSQTYGPYRQALGLSDIEHYGDRSWMQNPKKQIEQILSLENQYRKNKKLSELSIDPSIYQNWKYTGSIIDYLNQQNQSLSIPSLLYLYNLDRAGGELGKGLSGISSGYSQLWNRSLGTDVSNVWNTAFDPSLQNDWFNLSTLPNTNNNQKQRNTPYGFAFGLLGLRGMNQRRPRQQRSLGRL